MIRIAATKVNGRPEACATWVAISVKVFESHMAASLKLCNSRRTKRGGALGSRLRRCQRPRRRLKGRGCPKGRRRQRRGGGRGKPARRRARWSTTAVNPQGGAPAA